MFDIQTIAGLFDLRADYVCGVPYGSGHINDTYRIEVDQAGLRVNYILQRVNSNVFKQPIALMENVKRVTDEALRVLRVEGCKDSYRRTLTLIPAKDGSNALKLHVLSVTFRNSAPTSRANLSLKLSRTSTTPPNASTLFKMQWRQTRSDALKQCNGRLNGSSHERRIATKS